MARGVLVVGRALAALATFALVTATAPARADIQPDEHGKVAVLPTVPSPHWLWVPDRVLRHATLFDGDTGNALGTRSSSCTAPRSA
jgi:hypothetical protein